MPARLAVSAQSPHDIVVEATGEGGGIGRDLAIEDAGLIEQQVGEVGDLQGAIFLLRQSPAP